MVVRTNGPLRLEPLCHRVMKGLGLGQSRILFIYSVA
jgi:hypothetical protein